MLNTIIQAYKHRAREARRAALSRELDGIYAARRFFEKREKEIVREAKTLDAHEVHRSIPTRSARAW